MKRRKAPVSAEKAEYKATEQERTVLKKQLDRMDVGPPAPRLKVPKGEPGGIIIDHPNHMVGRALLSEALGTADLDFVDGILNQLATVSSDSKAINERGLNFLISVIKGVKPADQLETMIAAQMAVVHMATMKFAQHFALIETLPQLDTTERTVNKLARTFAMQMETLKRYRTGGEQKVTVQHVSVEKGGQAIVGNVTQASPEGKPKATTYVPPSLTDARQQPMPTIEEPIRERIKARREPGSSS